MTLVGVTGLMIVAASFGVKVAAALIVVRRLRFAQPTRRRPDLALPAVSIVVPIASLSRVELRTALSSLSVKYPEFEVLFCVYSETEPNLEGIVEAVSANPQRARLLFGRSNHSDNPKLDNVEKGWLAAKHPFVVIVDANVDVPHDFLDRLIAVWGAGVGAVSSPPIGVAPRGFWAWVESQFLNASQATWLIVADALGSGFAHGKAILLDRRVFAPLGGPLALRIDTAEDSAVTKVARAQNLRVRLVEKPFEQPLEERAFLQVFSRQLRWAQLRLRSFPMIFAIEPLGTITAPILGVQIVSFDTSNGCAATTALTIALWYGVEILQAWAVGWPVGPMSAPAAFIRDLLAVCIWPAAVLSNRYVWRGHRVHLHQSWSRATPKS